MGGGQVASSGMVDKRSSELQNFHISIFLKGSPLEGVNGGSGQICLGQFQYDSC